MNTINSSPLNNVKKSQEVHPSSVTLTEQEQP